MDIIREGISNEPAVDETGWTGEVFGDQQEASRFESVEGGGDKKYEEEEEDPGVACKQLHADRNIDSADMEEENFGFDEIEKLEQGNLGSEESLIRPLNEGSSYTNHDGVDSTSEMLFMKSEFRRMKIAMDLLKKEQASLIMREEERTEEIEELRSLVTSANRNTQPTDRQQSTARRRSMLGRTSSALLGSGYKISLDEDTFSLMMISPVASQPWLLGFSSFTFQMTLGVMIAIGQFGETEGSSLFGVPFRVNGPDVRVAQFLAIILCLSTQTDILTSVRSFFLLGTGSNWSEIICEESGRIIIGRRSSSSLWIARVGLPNTMKLSQGIVVTFTSFVIIVQNKDTIDLLKDFTSLMVISEFDNILFSLAAYGYLGEDLRLKTEKISEMNVITGDASAPQSQRKNGIIFIRLVFAVLLFAMFTGWGIIYHMQKEGTIFSRQFPGCGQEHYNLAYQKFDDGTCYGGPFNNIKCKYEAGDCANFNTAFPNCNGQDLAYLHDVEEKVGNSECDMIFDISQCEYDGGDCCPYSIHLSPFFGDGKCNGGFFNTEGCLYDNGDCEEFNALHADCPLNKTSMIETSSNVILGNGICEGGGYNIEKCGFEFGDCEKSQIGGEILLSDVFSPSSRKSIDFDMKTSEDGSKILVQMYHTDKMGEYDPNSNGKIAGYAYNNNTRQWVHDISLDKKRPATASFDNMWERGELMNVALNRDGSVVVIGSPTLDNGHVQVEIVDFWGQHNHQYVPFGDGSPGNFKFGSQLDLTADGLRIVISSPEWGDNDFKKSGKIEFYEKNHREDLWKHQVNGTITGTADYEEIGKYYLRINALDGTRVFFSAGKHSRSLRTYQLNSTSQEWFQAGSDDITVKHYGNDAIAISADGNRFALSFYSALQSDTPGVVEIYQWSVGSSLNDQGSWNQLGQPIPLIEDNRNGFGRSISMNADGTLLAISIVDPNCDGLNPFEVHNVYGTIVNGASTDLCPTGSIRLYRYKRTNPPHRPFSLLPYKRDANLQTIMEEQKQEADNTILGLQVSLSGDGSILTASGYDLRVNSDSGFVMSYNVTELFYIDCIVRDPAEIGNRECNDREPYYTEECGYDGGDCSPPSPVEDAGYNDCNVKDTGLILLEDDGECFDYLPYYSLQCKYSGGNCPLPSPVDGYPSCLVSNPEKIKDDECHDYLPYNSYECGFDGDACLPPEFASSSSPSGQPSTIPSISVSPTTSSMPSPSPSNIYSSPPTSSHLPSVSPSQSTKPTNVTRDQAGDNNANDYDYINDDDDEE